MPKCPECNRVVDGNMGICPYCATRMPPALSPDQPDLEARVRTLLDVGQKIEAIKLYREETGAGLAEAKEAVEAIARGLSPSARETGDATGIEGDVARLLGEGKKIAAIKVYREQMGCGLKEAKEAVEELGQKHGLVVKGSGCLGAVLVLLAFVFLK